MTSNSMEGSETRRSDRCSRMSSTGCMLSSILGSFHSSGKLNQPVWNRLQVSGRKPYTLEGCFSKLWYSCRNCSPFVCLFMHIECWSKCQHLHLSSLLAIFRHTEFIFGIHIHQAVCSKPEEVFELHFCPGRCNPPQQLFFVMVQSEL